jgi:hypothetical protein
MDYKNGTGTILKLMSNHASRFLTFEQATTLWGRCKTRLATKGLDETVGDCEKSTTGSLDTMVREDVMAVLGEELAGRDWPVNGESDATHATFSEAFQAECERRLYLDVNKWFAECFTNPVTREPYVFPDYLRALSERVCRAFYIRGVSDPMYIVNIAAFELGLGDGQGNFHSADLDAREQRTERSAKLAKRLCDSYGANITVRSENLATMLKIPAR